jgi:hypothetical protein
MFLPQLRRKEVENSWFEFRKPVVAHNSHFAHRPRRPNINRSTMREAGAARYLL